MSNLTWNIEPEVFHIVGPFGLRWYSMLFLAGILIGNAIFIRILEKEGKPTEIKDTLLYYIVFGTVIGARLGHCLFYDPMGYLNDPLSIFKVWEGGLASHGGFTGVIIALLLFSRNHKEFPIFWLLDRISIVALLAGAFIRIGNFFNSEIIGKPSDLPWAVIFSRIDSIPRHPSQLYEAVGYAAVSLCGYLIYSKTNWRNTPGRIFGFVLSAGFFYRFLMEFFKENQADFESGWAINMGQLLSLPFVVLGIIFMLKIHTKHLVQSQPQRPRRKAVASK